jgi:hypothetical protein
VRGCVLASYITFDISHELTSASTKYKALPPPPPLKHADLTLGGPQLGEDGHANPKNDSAEVQAYVDQAVPKSLFDKVTHQLLRSATRSPDILGCLRRCHTCSSGAGSPAI